MRTKEEIIAENKRLKAEYGKLFDQVTEILFRHDPIGLDFEDNTDEYQPEARTILPRLRTCHSSDDVVTVAFEEFQKWFHPHGVGDKERYRALGKEIWNVWKQRDRIS